MQSRTTKERAQRSLECRDRLDFEVFLLVDATRADEIAVRAALEANPAIRRATFVNKKRALRVFRCIFVKEGKFYRDVTADALPASFWVTTVAGADLATLVREIEALPGVESVTFLPEPAEDDGPRSV